ncbi:MAG: C40 family peptidase [Muribaculaceae bacterium]|nr:C40 family peptidase [Muribaculaceae bacterium]
MKRKFLRILISILAFSIVFGMPSCRTSKDTAESNYQNVHKKRGRKKKAKIDKTNSDLPKTDSKIVMEAYGWLGTPYGYGMAEKGKGCDCSGMVMSVYEKVRGVRLPRNSAQQQDFCKKLKKKDVKVGDLCFFATGKDPDKTSHVGIMIDETNFIHASTSKGVVVSDITQPYYVRTFTGFGRVPLSND